MIVKIVSLALAFYVIAGPALAMTQEEIFYTWGLKSDGSPHMYENELGDLFRTVEECKSALSASCRFTVRDVFESEEEMTRRFNEWIRRFYQREKSDDDDQTHE